MIILSSVEENDLTALKTATADNLTHRNIFADKNILRFLFLEKQAAGTDGYYVNTRKSNKGRRNHYYSKKESRKRPILYSGSKVRQPIESFFNWMNEKTNIQRAMKVRSTAGLLVHTMGKIAIAFIYLIF